MAQQRARHREGCKCTSGLQRILKRQWAQWKACTSNSVHKLSKAALLFHSAAVSHLQRPIRSGTFPVSVTVKTTAASGSPLLNLMHGKIMFGL